MYEIDKDKLILNLKQQSEAIAKGMSPAVAAAKLGMIPSEFDRLCELLLARRLTRF